MAPEIAVASYLIGDASKPGLPAIVEDGSRLGDWELDTVIGKGHKKAIVSLADRKARLAIIAKVEQKIASQVATMIIRLLSPQADRVHTLTSDNDKEFAQQKDIAEALIADFYFARPYAS